MLPKSIFDSHLHIIDPLFPLVSNRGFTPAPFDVAAYQARTRQLPLVGGAVVSGSFQAFDTCYLTSALQQLGDGYVGIAQVPLDIADEEILRLDAAGVRGIRFNYHRGRSISPSALLRLGQRVAEVANWHVELYIDAARLESLNPALSQLPAVAIDHLGLSAKGLPTLLRAVAQGVHVKATGFSRGDLAISSALQSIHQTNPKALMFGTDLPCTRAPREFGNRDINTLVSALEEAALEGVFCNNALAFYRLPSKTSAAD